MFLLPDNGLKRVLQKLKGQIIDLMPSITPVEVACNYAIIAIDKAECRKWKNKTTYRHY